MKCLQNYYRIWTGHRYETGGYRCIKIIK